MIHKCSICGRTLDCNEDCDEPEMIPMNCGIEIGTPYHQEEYHKMIEARKN